MIKIATFVLILQNEFFDLAEETIDLQTDCYFFDDSAKSTTEFDDLNIKIANLNH